MSFFRAMEVSSSCGSGAAVGLDRGAVGARLYTSADHVLAVVGQRSRGVARNRAAGMTTRVAPRSASVGHVGHGLGGVGGGEAAHGDLDAPTGRDPASSAAARMVRDQLRELAPVDAEGEEAVPDSARPPGGDLGVAADVDRDGPAPGLGSQVDVAEADRRAFA